MWQINLMFIRYILLYIFYVFYILLSAASQSHAEKPPGPPLGDYRDTATMDSDVRSQDMVVLSCQV